VWFQYSYSWVYWDSLENNEVSDNLERNAKVYYCEHEGFGVLDLW